MVAKRLGGLIAGGSPAVKTFTHARKITPLKAGGNMSNKILLMHEFSILRRLLSSYLSTEFGHMDIETTDTPQDALRLCKNNDYNLVFFDHEMDAMPCQDFVSQFRSLERHKNTPFIVITSGAHEPPQDLLEQDLSSLLITPFTPKQVRETVNEALDPRSRRGHQRFNISDTRAYVNCGDLTIELAVINFSAGGVLARLDNPPGRLLTQAVEFGFVFPANYGSAEVQGIKSTPVRFNAIAWDQEGKPLTYRAAWKFLSMPKSANDTLNMVIDWAVKDLNKAAEQVLQ
jgi:CheY-like chemotaxis protein